MDESKVRTLKDIANGITRLDRELGRMADKEGVSSRELSLARTKLQEARMWVKEHNDKGDWDE